MNEYTKLDIGTKVKCKRCGIELGNVGNGLITAYLRKTDGEIYCGEMCIGLQRFEEENKQCNCSARYVQDISPDIHEANCRSRGQA